jgi:hypothetical protein
VEQGLTGKQRQTEQARRTCAGPPGMLQSLFAKKPRLNPDG